MARVYFFNGGAYGHVFPTLGWTAELARRGEDVIYYGTETFRPLIERTGATFRPYAVEAPDEALTGHAHMLDYQLRYGAALLPGLIETARVERPDYVIYDMLRPWGLHLARILGVPAIVSSPSFAFNQAVMLAAAPEFVLQMFKPRRGGPAEGGDYARHYQDLARELKARYGVETPPLMTALGVNADLTLVSTARRFQPYPWLLPRSVRYIGPSLDIRPPAAGFDLGALEGRPLVLISLGTVFNGRLDFWRASLEAFAGSEYGVVMAVGEATDIGALGPLPDNFIVRPFVPQLDVLRRAAVFVTHGGMGSVHEALHHHVPMVLYPQMAEQMVTARQVVRHGAGLALIRRTPDMGGTPALPTPAELRAAVRRALGDPRYRRGAERLGREMQRYTPGAAAETVLEFVHGRTASAGRERAVAAVGA